MSIFGTRHYDLLLANMLRSPAILDQAAATLQASYLADQRIGGTQTQFVIFQAIVSYYQTYHAAPDTSILQVEVISILDRCLGPDPAARAFVARELQAFFQFVTVVTDVSLPMTRDIIGYITKICVYKDRVEAALGEALSSGEYESLEAKLSLLTQEQRGVTGGVATSGLGTAVNADESAVPRIKLNVDFLDEMFYRGNGPPSGCGLAIIGAQGMGKTTLGVQLCTSAALVGNDAVLVLAEEGLSVEVKRNLRAAMTGISTTVFETVNDNWVKAAEIAGVNVDVVRTKLQLMDKHLHVIDLIQNPMGMDGIETEIQRLVMQGVKPKIIYVDWAGELADYLMENPGKRKFDSREPCIRYIGDTVASWGPKFGCIAVVSQQMAGSWSIKGPMYEYGYSTALDSKLFTQSFKYVWVLAPRHEGTGLQYLRMPKARNDKPGVNVLVRLVGDKATFVKAEGYEKAGKNFRKVAKEAGLPKETAGALD